MIKIKKRFFLKIKNEKNKMSRIYGWIGEENFGVWSMEYGHVAKF